MVTYPSPFSISPHHSLIPTSLLFLSPSHLSPSPLPSFPSHTLPPSLSIPSFSPTPCLVFTLSPHLPLAVLLGLISIKSPVSIFFSSQMSQKTLIITYFDTQLAIFQHISKLDIGVLDQLSPIDEYHWFLAYLTPLLQNKCVTYVASGPQAFNSVFV